MKPTLSLLDQAAELNKSLENSYIGLAIVLVDIQEQELFKEAGYEDFASYYKNGLGREKSTVSRLLTVGKWLKENGLLGATVPYARLALAIKTYPDKPANFVLSAAKTLSSAELYAEKTEANFGADHEHTPKDEKRYAKCGCGIFFQV